MSERKAARTAASGTARSSLIVIDVSARTRFPIVRVATSDPVPAAAVSTTVRIGAPSLPPSSERALPSMVTVYSVSGRQWAVGAIVRWRPAASHETLIGPSGEIRSAPATDAASMGASNSISIGSFVP